MVKPEMIQEETFGNFYLGCPKCKEMIHFPLVRNPFHIYDAFMGSGTTAIACMNTNRHYIGYELDEKYFNIAQERISQYGREH